MEEKTTNGSPIIKFGEPEDSLTKNIVLESKNLMTYPEGITFLRKKCNEQTQVYVLEKKENKKTINIGLIFINFNRGLYNCTCIIRNFDLEWLNEEVFRSFICGFYKNHRLMILSNEFNGWGTRKINILVQELDIVIPNKYNNLKINNETKRYLIDSPP